MAVVEGEGRDTCPKCGRAIPKDSVHKCNEQHAISIGDLIRMCNDRASGMGNTNENKALLLNCAYAMKQLVDRLSLQEGTVQ